jgi:hypothetical protein
MLHAFYPNVSTTPTVTGTTCKNTPLRTLCIHIPTHGNNAKIYSYSFQAPSSGSEWCASKCLISDTRTQYAWSHRISPTAVYAPHSSPVTDPFPKRRVLPITSLIGLWKKKFPLFVPPAQNSWIMRSHDARRLVITSVLPIVTQSKSAYLDPHKFPAFCSENL